MKRLLMLVFVLTFAGAGMAQLSKFATRYEKRVLKDISDNPVLNLSQPSNNMVQSKAALEAILGTTRYDLQTNESIQNRFYVYPDGTMAGVWTMGQVETAYSDRGTGYNYFNGSNWGSPPSARIESIRTGWPSLCPWMANGEMVLAHNSTTSLVMNTRPVKGTGGWTQTLVPVAPSGAPGLAWPRAITNGTNHQNVHIIAMTQPEASGGALYNGLDGALLYWRSTDGGTTWDKNGIQLPGMTSDYYDNFNGDEYAWGSPHGDTIYFAVGGPYTDTFIMKSTDNGNSWTKIPILSNASKKISSSVTDLAPWRSSDGAIACEMGKNGIIHFSSGIGGGLMSAGTKYIRINLNGLIYWNTTMPMLRDSLNLDTLYAHKQLAGYYSDGPNVGDTLRTMQSYRIGMTSHPQISIDGTGNICLLWDQLTWANPEPSTGNNFRHIYARGWFHNEPFWSLEPIDLNSDISYIFMEFVYPSLAKTVLNGNLNYICQTANTPGCAVLTTTLATKTCNIEHRQLALSTLNGGTYTNTTPVTTAATKGAPYNSPVTVPVTVSGFANITAVSLRLDYNPAVLTFLGSSNLNAQLSGLIVNDIAVSSSLHKIMIIWSDLNSQTLTTGSKLVDLNFTYLSGTTALTWNNTASGGSECEYADINGDPLPDVPTSLYYINGEVHWQPGYQLSGTLTYNNAAATVLDNVKVVIKQGTVGVDSTTTNSSGFYSFTNVMNGTYRVSAITTKPFAGVNGTDAIKIQRHFAGLELLSTPIRIQAADVNLSNSINGTDAIKIKRRFAGLDNSFPRGDWTFAKPTGGDTVIVNGGNVTQDFQGLCVGDVNGSNVPGAGKGMNQKVILDRDGVIEVSPGQEFDLPLFVKQNMNLSAISLVIPFPEEYLAIESIQFKGINPLYKIVNGEIRFVWSEPDNLDLKAGDELLVLKMKASENFNGNLAISLNANEESEFADERGEAIPLATLGSYTVRSLNQANAEGLDEVLVQRRIFPNPASDLVNLEVELKRKANVTVEIMDLSGVLKVKMNKGRLNAGINNFSFSTEVLPAGMYLLKWRISNEQGRSDYFNKLIINK